MSQHQSFARRLFDRITEANMRKAERRIREHRALLGGERFGR